MKMPKATLIALAALAVVPSSSDAFAIPSAFLRTIPSVSPSSLFMGKSMTMPGPAGKGSSGPATSEFRQKKMSKRLKGKKNKGGFTNYDDEDGDESKKSWPVMEIELVAEPENGEEVSPLAALDEGDFAIRLKDLGPVDSLDEAYGLKEKLGGEVHNFWLTAVAEGPKIQKTRNIVLKDASKNANFPGFRKGQVPPYAQPKMTFFALREVIISSCQEAIQKFGVNEINEGELGAVTFNEDVDAISKKYITKTCPSVPFTANFRAIYDPDAVRDTVDAAAEENETTADAAEATEDKAEPAEETA